MAFQTRRWRVLENHPTKELRSLVQQTVRLRNYDNMVGYHQIDAHIANAVHAQKPIRSQRNPPSLSLNTPLGGLEHTNHT